MLSGGLEQIGNVPFCTLLDRQNRFLAESPLGLVFWSQGLHEEGEGNTGGGWFAVGGIRGGSGIRHRHDWFSVLTFPVVIS